jgi:hypothetical protein
VTKTIRRWAPLTALLAMPCGGVLAQSRVPDFHARFAQEADAMRRAQAMPKLGESEFDEITRDIDSGKLPEAVAVLQEYRDEIQSCEKGLDERKIDAEKHPKGYKQLEISLRESLRKLNNLLVSFTADEQKPFVAVRDDLEALNRHLIRELFPKGPNDGNTPPD